MPTHLLQLSDHDPAWVARVLDAAESLRREHREAGANRPILERKSLAMIFEKPSLRTRVSFETAMTQLGGHAINLQPAEIGLNSREPAGDVARVLGGMVDAIMARVFDHNVFDDLAGASAVPMVNGLSDLAHPCQALADLLTLRDAFGTLDGLRVAYVGDANNVLRSLAVGCGLMGVDVVACSPDGYDLSAEERERLARQVPSLSLTCLSDPREAVAGADAIYTDTWVSMGQETEKARRVDAFRGYQVNADLLNATGKAGEAIVLHCLPAYRGLEISEELMASPRSRIFEQAHNRLHAQKGLLAVLLAKANG